MSGPRAYGYVESGPWPVPPYLHAADLDGLADYLDGAPYYGGGFGRYNYIIAVDFMPTLGSTDVIWGHCDPTLADEYVYVAILSTGAIQGVQREGGAASATSPATPIIAGEWNRLLIRNTYAGGVTYWDFDVNNSAGLYHGQVNHAHKTPETTVGTIGAITPLGVVTLPFEGRVGRVLIWNTMTMTDAQAAAIVGSMDFIPSVPGVARPDHVWLMGDVPGLWPGRRVNFPTIYDHAIWSPTTRDLTCHSMVAGDIVLDRNLIG